MVVATARAPMHLRRDRYGAAYLGRLSEGFEVFKKFLLYMNIVWSEVCQYPARMVDRLCVDFVQWCYDCAFNLSTATHGLLAVQHKLHLKRQLSEAWESIRTWKTEEPPSTRTPFSPYLLSAILLYCVSTGMRCSGRDRALYFGALVVFRVGFYGLLRPVEIIELTVRQLGFPDSILLGGGSALVVLIFRPKTRRYLGRRQFSMVNDEDTVAWVKWFCNGLGPDDKVFPGSAGELRRILKKAIDFFGLRGLGLTLAGLRTGGATYFFRKDENIGKLQFMGRWRQQVTLQHYLQERMSAHLLANLSFETEMLLRFLAPRLTMTARPPPTPAPVLLPWKRFRDAVSLGTGR